MVSALVTPLNFGLQTVDCLMYAVGGGGGGAGGGSEVVVCLAGWLKVEGVGVVGGGGG